MEMVYDCNTGRNLPKSHCNALIALGANLKSPIGEPDVTLRAALESLARAGATIRAVSRFFQTPAFPRGNGPDYVNAAAALEVPWSTTETLAQLHAVEAALGRERVQRWGQRTLDLDLIAFDDLVVPDLDTHRIWRDLPPAEQIERTPEQLILPHPRMQDRAFVLVPLCDVAPDWRDPVSGMTVRQMCTALPEVDKNAVVAL